MAVHEIRRTALVVFTPEQMFDLVIDVERYPEFLPWVAGAELHTRGERDLEASLSMQRSGVTERFSTRNEFVRPDWMTMTLVNGPFRMLEGRWTFARIGDAGTRIELTMRFEFASRVVEMLFGRSFEQSCNSLIDAFIARARARYLGG